MDRHGSITDIRDDIQPNVGATTWLSLRTHDAAMRTARARPAVSPLLPSASLRPAANGTSPQIKPRQVARGPHCPAAELIADAPHGSVTYVSLLLTASLRALGPR